MNTQSHNIWLIIVTYNAEDWIEKCLSSVRESSIKPNIIIVDNASHDSTAQIIETDFPEVKLFINSQNEGFGRANNLGIKIALNACAEFIFLLNQDAKIAPDMLFKLMSVAVEQPKYGILSPLHLNYEGDLIDPHFIQYVLNGYSKLSSDLFFESVEQIYEFPFLPAAAWLINCSALKKVGGFDPLFFMYGEDYDLCLRMLRSGYKIGLVPQAIACHHHGGFPKPKPSIKRRVWFVYWEMIIKLKDPKQSFAKNLVAVSREQLMTLISHVINCRIKTTYCLLLGWFQVIPKLGAIRSHYYLCQSEAEIFLLDSNEKEQLTHQPPLEFS